MYLTFCFLLHEASGANKVVQPTHKKHEVSIHSTTAGNWGNVARLLKEHGKQGTKTLAVFFTDDESALKPDTKTVARSGEQQCVAPMAWSQLALAILRVYDPWEYNLAKEHVGESLPIPQVKVIHFRTGTESFGIPKHA